MIFLLDVEVVEGLNFRGLESNYQIVVQSSLLGVGDSVKESAPSEWYKGVRSEKPIWRNLSGLMSFKLTESDMLKSLKKIRCDVYAVNKLKNKGEESKAIKLGSVDISCLSDNNEIVGVWYPLGNDLSIKVKVGVRQEGNSYSHIHKPRINHDKFLPTSSSDAINMYLGSPSHSLDYFTFSIILSEAFDLDSISVREGGGDNFWFSYNLFGLLIQTDTFHSLSSSNFPAVKDSVRLNGSLLDAIDFFSSLYPIEVHLCSRDGILASTVIQFESLVTSMKQHSDNGHLFGESCLEGLFPLVTKRHNSFTSTSASIKMRIELIREEREEEKERNFDAKKVQLEEKKDYGEKKIFKISLINLHLKNSTEDIESWCNEGIIIRVSCGNGSHHVESQVIDINENFVEAESSLYQHLLLESYPSSMIYVDVIALKGNHAVAMGQINMASLTSTGQNVDLINGDGNIGFVSLSLGHIPAPPPVIDTPFITQDVFNDDRAHTLRFSIDIKSIKDLSRSSHIYIKYTFNSFGTQSLMRSRPAVMVPRNCECKLPNAFGMFEFNMKGISLANVLANKPFEIEVWRKHQYRADERVGVCIVPLEALFSCKPIFKNQSTNKIIERKKIFKVGEAIEDFITFFTYDSVYNISQLRQDGRLLPCGALRVCLILEDFGLCPSTATLITPRGKIEEGEDDNPVVEKTNETEYLSDSFEEEEEKTNQSPEKKMENSFTNIQKSPNNKPAESFDRKSAESEFETWRINQERIWREGLHQERERILQLAKDEIREKEDKREREVKKIMGECVKLESNLRNKLSIVQEREKNLISLEEKLKNDFAAKSMDVSLSQKRMKEEMVHKVNLEKSKVTDLQSRYEQIKHELEKEKNKVKGVEEEFNEYRKRMRSTKENELQTKISTLIGEKDHLENQIERQVILLESEKQTNNSLKTQLIRLAREVQGLREEKKREVESDLAQLRIQYMAREEKFKLDGDREELKSIKEQLDQLKSVSANVSLNISNTPLTSPQNKSETVVTEVERIEKEISDLLKGGKYSKDDMLVLQLKNSLKIAKQSLLFSST